MGEGHSSSGTSTHHGSTVCRTWPRPGRSHATPADTASAAPGHTVRGGAVGGAWDAPVKRVGTVPARQSKGADGGHSTRTATGGHRYRGAHVRRVDLLRRRSADLGR